jgi:small conductance mechanosensitive channel
VVAAVAAVGEVEVLEASGAEASEVVVLRVAGENIKIAQLTGIIMEKLMSYLDLLTDMAVKYVPQFLLALAVLVTGFWIIKRIRKIAERSISKADLSKEIVSFLVSLIDIVLKIFLLLTVAGMVGIETASLIGVLAAAGFAVGLALQGSLGNFAAGIIILLFKPYKLGDWVEVSEKFGRVEEIQIFNTILVTPGLKTLVIPNGKVIDGVVSNFSRKGKIRLEIEVTMPFEESFPRVRKVIEKELASNPDILTDPAPEIGIAKFGSHAVILAVRPYVRPDDYWQVSFDVHRQIKAAFHENNIKVAYPDGMEIGNVGE